STTTVPAAQNFHGFRFMPGSIKDFKVPLYDESPDSSSLTYFRRALRKRTEAFSNLDNILTQFLGCCGIVSGNASYDSFKIRQEAILIDYFEVHSLNRARTSFAENP